MSQYSLDELKEMKRAWYSEAEQSGLLARIATVCRELGSRLNANYGPKYEFVSVTTVIYVDDYGHYMTVRADGKEVCSTHPCSRLFVPGEWAKQIDALYTVAVAKLDEKAAERTSREKDELARELGLA